MKNSGWKKRSKTAGRKVVLATKFGEYCAAADGAVSLGVSGKPEYVRSACCDASLKRPWSFEYIDLYYQHRVDPNTPIEETVSADGRIGSWWGKSAIPGNEPKRAAVTLWASQAHASHRGVTDGIIRLWSREVEAEILPGLAGRIEDWIRCIQPAGPGIFDRQNQSRG